MKWCLLICLLLVGLVASNSGNLEESKTLTVDNIDSEEKNIKHGIEEEDIEIFNIAENKREKEKNQKNRNAKKKGKKRRQNETRKKKKISQKGKNKKKGKVNGNRKKRKNNKVKNKRRRAKKKETKKDKEGKDSKKGKGEKQKSKKKTQTIKNRQVKGTKKRKQKVAKNNNKNRKVKKKIRRGKKNRKKEGRKRENEKRKKIIEKKRRKRLRIKKEKRKKEKETSGKKRGKKRRKEEMQNKKDSERQELTEDKCAEIILSSIKLERKAVNYMRQYNRSRRFLVKTDQKLNKKSEWAKSSAAQDPMSLLIKCGGNDEANMKCAGSTTSRKSQMMTTLMENLKNCTPNIGTQCKEDLMPQKGSEFDQCAKDLMAFQVISTQCLRMVGSKACECYNTDEAKDLYDKGKACSSPDMVKYERTVKNTKDNCVAKFRDCRVFQDELAVVMMTCCGEGGVCPT